jgi:hypothetical protein
LFKASFLFKSSENKKVFQKMKKFILIILALAMLAPAFAQSNGEKKSNGAVLTFVETSHDFGDIYQGDKVSTVFKFQNSGNEPLILSNVSTTCGCTAPNWPKEPIAPGKSGEITVTFNSAGKMGVQNKVVTIYSNAVNAQERVKIITNILPAKKDS